MATKHTVSKLVLEPRSKIGTTGSHALRAEGKIPGVVYGQEQQHRGQQIGNAQTGQQFVLPPALSGRLRGQ